MPVVDTKTINDKEKKDKRAWYISLVLELERFLHWLLYCIYEISKKKKICSPESRIFPVDNSLGKILCVWMYILPGFSEVAQLRNLSPSRAPPCKQPSKMEIQFQTFIQAPGSLIMSIKQLFKVFWVYTLSIFLFLPLLILPNIP